MDAIDTFLDAMFAPYPATPRLLEAKGELHAMMEDAYTDAISKGKTHNEAVGQVITDFGNLEELAPVLGILPDIRSTQTGSATAAPQAAPGIGEAPAAEPGYPAVTLPEAQRLAKARQTTALVFRAGSVGPHVRCRLGTGPPRRRRPGRPVLEQGRRQPDVRILHPGHDRVRRRPAHPSQPGLHRGQAPHTGQVHPGPDRLRLGRPPAPGA